MDASERRLQGLTAAFEESCRVSSPVRVRSYRMCGESVRMRIAGAALEDHIAAPFAHLSAVDVPAEPRLRIDLWDARATEVPGPPPPECHAAGRSWEGMGGVFAVSADGSIVSHEQAGSVVWLDRRAGTMTGWFADAERLSMPQRGRPLQTLLALWASDLGVKAVHAAGLAVDGCGVLVPGVSGSGKSTVALTCLEAGYVYLGDDWLGVRRSPDGSFVGYGLYSTAYLDPSHARRFPGLAGCALPPEGGSGDKALLLLSRLLPERLGSTAAIHALALPRIVKGAARVQRASKAEALLRLAPSAVLEMSPRAGREELEHLAELVERVPAYWLDFGPDLREIPLRVREISLLCRTAGP